MGNFMKDIKELCKLINSMGMVQSIKIETHYNVVKDWYQRNVVIVYAPSMGDFYYQDLLKVTFFCTSDCQLDDMSIVFSPFAIIENVTKLGWEDVCYFLEDEYYSFYFRSFKYEWIQKEITFDEEQGY